MKVDSDDKVQILKLALLGLWSWEHINVSMWKTGILLISYWHDLIQKAEALLCQQRSI